jgi:hypothetical protein
MHNDYSGEHKKIQESWKNGMLLGSTRKSVKGRKKLLQFIAASMFWLVWTARGKNACKLQVLLVMLLHNEESNRELKSWL